MGMPILTQELALGHHFRSGDIEAFGRINWRLRGIGLASVVGAYCIVICYVYCFVFVFDSSKRIV